MKEELLAALLELLASQFSHISKPLRKNLALLTVAFVSVLSTVRSANGRLSLAALARALPTRGSFHTREKRLHRFLANRRLDYQGMVSIMAPLVLSQRKGLCPIVVDQTKSGATQALLAAVPYGGRALPLACYTFEYPFNTLWPKSQNQLEHIFLLHTEEALPSEVQPVWVADRGYARAALLEQSETENRLYIIRARKGTVITFGGRRMKLHQLTAEPYTAIRYEDVSYHAQRQVLVDVVVYHDPNYEETWYLLVPPALRPRLSAEDVVSLYRERMQIEQSFRDFKTHLGMRGLKLHVDVAERMGRLLLSFLLAYMLCVMLGESPLGKMARDVFETPRRTPRHGTRRTLSALMIAMIMLSHSAWNIICTRFLIRILLYAKQNQSLPSLHLLSPCLAMPP